MRSSPGGKVRSTGTLMPVAKEVSVKAGISPSAAEQSAWLSPPPPVPPPPLPPPDVEGPPSVPVFAPPTAVLSLVVLPALVVPPVPEPVAVEVGPEVVGPALLLFVGLPVVPLVVVPIPPVVGPIVPMVGPAVVPFVSAPELDFDSSLLQAVAQTTASVVTEENTETRERVSRDICSTV